MKQEAIIPLVSKAITVALVSLLVAVSLALITTSGFGSAGPSEGAFLSGTPSANDVFLPVVMKQPTQTPTVTPTPTATPVPKLMDGNYRASLSSGGDIHFTVSSGGTVASNAGFLFKNAPWCPWGIYEFSGSTSITGGSFGFTAVNVITRELIANMSCSALSSTQASCSVSRRGLGGGCIGTNGICTRQ